MCSIVLFLSGAREVYGEAGEREAALNKIAKGLERLKSIAAANDLRVVGYLLDTTLREARDQVAENDGEAPLDEQKPPRLDSEAAS